VESAPRAYKLKVSNAAPPISTSVGTSPPAGNVPERHFDDVGAVTIGDFVFVDRSARRPANFSSLVLGRLFDRLPGQSDEALPQMFETHVAERWAKSGDKAVELAIIIVGQGLERAIGNVFRIALSRFGQPRKIVHAFAENSDNRAAADVAAQRRTRPAP